MQDFLGWCIHFGDIWCDDADYAAVSKVGPKPRDCVILHERHWHQRHSLPCAHHLQHEQRAQDGGHEDSKPVCHILTVACSWTLLIYSHVIYVFKAFNLSKSNNTFKYKTTDFTTFCDIDLNFEYRIFSQFRAYNKLCYSDFVQIWIILEIIKCHWKLSFWQPFNLWINDCWQCLPLLHY